VRVTVKHAAGSAGQQAAAAAKGVHPKIGCFGEQAKFSLRADWDHILEYLRGRGSQQPVAS
jgi:hypothetical protein